MDLGFVRLHQFLLMAQPRKGWLLSLLAVLVLGFELLRGWQKDVGAANVLGAWKTVGITLEQRELDHRIVNQAEGTSHSF